MQQEQFLRGEESGVWVPVLSRSLDQVALQAGKNPAGLEAVVPQLSKERVLLER